MADEVLVLKGEGNVDVQVGGPGNSWDYLSACAHMSGPTVPRGSTEIRWCQDPNRANGFKISSKFRTAPDQVTADLMTKLGKIDYLDRLDCPFSLRARFTKCGEREDPSNYDPIMLSYCDVELGEHSYDDLVVIDPGNQDEIIVTAPWAAASEYRVKSVNPTRTGTAATLGDQPVNDIEYCSEHSCGGYCGSATDDCTTAYGVTDADNTPYAAPNLIKGSENSTTGAITWTSTPILGINGNVDGIECAGSRLVVHSNADSVIAYNDQDGDQDEWNLVTIGNAPAANHAALYARTARELWLGCAGGYIYKSIDGGATWSAMHSGEWTTETINAVYAYDRDLIYAAGNNGVMLKSSDGGTSWDDITEVATTSSNILVIIVPGGRPKEVYIGTNAGQIFRSTDEGATFSAYSFDGSGVGTVDDIDFCGPCGSDVMWFVQNDAGPRARIFRDLSGGAGGADVEMVMDWLDVIATGIELNALSCCGVNQVLVAGENYNSYPVIVKVS